MPDQADYTAALSEESLDNLRGLLGHSLWQLWSPPLSLDGASASACSFSIGVARREYVAISSSWYESPRNWLDYFELRVQLLNTPLHVDRLADGALSSASTILLNPPSPITSIDVLEWREECTDERIRYDHGVILTRLDGVRVAITAQRSIAGQLEVTQDAGTIDSLLRVCQIRLRYEAPPLTTLPADG